MHETLWEMHRTQDQFIAQVDLLTQKIIELQNTLTAQQQQKEHLNTQTAPVSMIPSHQSIISLPVRSDSYAIHGDSVSTREEQQAPSGSALRVDSRDCIRL